MNSPTPGITVPSSQDPFTEARNAWRRALVGGDYDPLDPAFAARLTAVAETARIWQHSMIQCQDRTSLWDDLPLGANETNMAMTALRLREMAMGWAAAGASSYRDPGLAAAVVQALDWFTATIYTETGAAAGNWYEWEISTPQAINDAVVLLFEQFTPAQIASYVAAQAHYVPRMPTTGTKAAAANLALLADAVSGRGVLSSDGDTVSAALLSLSSLLRYARPHGGPAGMVDGDADEEAFFSNDGFHTDGSFIQHGQFPYAGGYGSSLLTSMAATIVRTEAFAAELDTSIMYNWLHDSFEPFLWNGLVMDTVRGRNLAFSGDGGHEAGHGILAASLLLLVPATGMERARLAALLKQELLADTADDPCSSFSLAAFSVARKLLTDPAVVPRGPLVSTHVFAAMDRILHRRETFAVVVAMNSWRMANYESGSKDNLAGWYTADGAMYLYADEPASFGNGYWFTVDPYRIPGTTVDTVHRSRVAVPWRAEYHNPDYWAGGVTGPNWGVAGLRLRAEPPSSLQCRKSWFFFGDEILCLGDGITVDPGRGAETILENRLIPGGDGARITIDGALLAGEGHCQVPRAGWAHVEGVAGYVLTEPTSLNVLREVRTGTLSDISPQRSEEAVSNTFATLWLDHEAEGSDSYGYVLLPLANAESTRGYAERPPMSIVQRSAVAHAARHETTGRLGIAFFTAGRASFVTAMQACAVAIDERDSELVVSLSDPTQCASSLVLELDLELEVPGLLSAGDGITLSQTAGKTRIHVDVATATGASRSISFRYALTPAALRKRLRALREARALTSASHVVLEGCLDGLENAVLEGGGALAQLACFRQRLSELAPVVEPCAHAELSDLASRLVARLQF